MQKLHDWINMSAPKIKIKINMSVRNINDSVWVLKSILRKVFNIIFICGCSQYSLTLPAKFDPCVSILFCLYKFESWGNYKARKFYFVIRVQLWILKRIMVKIDSNFGCDKIYRTIFLKYRSLLVKKKVSSYVPKKFLIL